MSTISVPDRMLQPITDCLTPEVARRIVDTRLDPSTQAHIDRLAEKANRGTLTEEGKAAYAEFVEYIDLVGIFKATARRILKRQEA